MIHVVRVSEIGFKDESAVSEIRKACAVDAEQIKSETSSVSSSESSKTPAPESEGRQEVEDEALNAMYLGKDYNNVQFQESREEVFRVFCSTRSKRRWLSRVLTSERITSLGWLKEQASGVYDLPGQVSMDFVCSLTVKLRCLEWVPCLVTLLLANSWRRGSSFFADVRRLLGFVEDIVEEMLQLVSGS
ncbi:hypothetical protein V6N11_019383 [Hibiscus sabdariffa]|uniref:Uncharacterized protein n=1 Tax=Hibiscus sabdariffa TaxID=183260 RepID=A0ABR2R2N8_9ROSI